ncbi:DUF2254 domain-containing protein [Bradyrhizobium icense]|nr:DUF2254 domain-containing protein [Bradyrhizobium icense]
MAAAAVGLSLVTTRLDRWIADQAVREFEWIYAFGPEGARAVLAAIASSMITVAGLTFSITMLTLQLASSQFGHRILRNFMRDRGNQVVLGTFVATFVYCLLILRTVKGTPDSSFVPHLSVAMGVLLAIASLAVLIFFIHHIASTIRIETLLAQLTEEARCTIERLYPEQLNSGTTAQEGRIQREEALHQVAREYCEVRSKLSGYIQMIDDDAIMEQATACDLLLRIEAGPGSFVQKDEVILSVWSAVRGDDVIGAKLQDSIVIGQERTPSQDLDFAVHRIVEIAQRALSPAVNDPTTAIYCLDRVEELLTALAGRKIPGALRYDDEGKLRVVTEVLKLDQFVRKMMAGIARHAIADPDVISRALHVLERIAKRAPPNSRASLKAFADDLAVQHRSRFSL